MSHLPEHIVANTSLGHRLLPFKACVAALATKAGRSLATLRHICVPQQSSQRRKSQSVAELVLLSTIQTMAPQGNEELTIFDLLIFSFIRSGSSSCIQCAMIAKGAYGFEIPVSFVIRPSALPLFSSWSDAVYRFLLADVFFFYLEMMAR